MVSSLRAGIAGAGFEIIETVRPDRTGAWLAGIVAGDERERADVTTGAAVRVLDLPTPVDLAVTLGPLRRGHGDPCMRIAGGAVLRASRTPDGPASLHLSSRPDGGVVARAWGPGRRWALDHAAELCGAGDDPAAFTPADPLVRELHRRRAGLRIPRSLAVTEALVPTILEQKVTGAEARRSYRQLVLRHGEPAPGPGRLFVPPSPATFARLPAWAFHQAGVERKRADTIRIACSCAATLDALTDLPADQAGQRLQALPGVGPWSAAEVGRVALGDADAVSVGDYHLPHQVAWALAGEPRGTDERMLELLAPFAGHRGRVTRLIELAVFGAPRRGPRMAVKDISRL